MRIDLLKQQAHITEIKDGIKSLERFTTLGDQDLGFRIGIEAMKTACATYEKVVMGELPIDYSNDKIKECFHYVAAAMDLARYLKSINDKGKLKKARAHFDLIGAGGFGISATYQKQQFRGSIIEDRYQAFTAAEPNLELARDAARKSLELMLALAAMNKFDGVTLEDPNNSSSGPKNPDLIIKDGNETYGIASKSISSENRTNFLLRIREAAKQIQDSIADGSIQKGKGIVFLDISPLLDHDFLYMPEGIYSWKEGTGGKVLTEHISEILFKVLGQEKIGEMLAPIFSGSDVAPCILVYAHSLMLVEKGLGVFPHYYKALRVVYCGDHSSVKSFLKRLNEALHCQ